MEAALPELAGGLRGQPRVTTTGNGLKLGGFAALAWDWTEFGSTVSHHEEFGIGEVEFVAAMG